MKSLYKLLVCKQIYDIKRAVGDGKKWAYKLDIHDYFNSISTEILLPVLAEVMTCDPSLYRFFENMLTDDIILFADDYEALMGHRRQMETFLRQYRLEVYPDKERIYSPDEAYEFLGFRCHGQETDISESAKKKMKA